MTNRLTSNSNNIVEANPDCENWIVLDDCATEAYHPEETALPADPYRLFRFLTDLEDILLNIKAIASALKQLCL